MNFKSIFSQRALWLVLMVCMASGVFAAEKERPNIIFLLTDDMGYGDTGPYGGKIVPTPNIDRLAKEGTQFLNYYSASPICSPSRTGLLTGMHPARWNITSFLQTRKGNRACGQADFLDPKAPSVARALKQSGYATAHIGKWHMGGGRDVTNAPPFSAYGFDEHVSTYESPEPDPTITARDWIWSPDDKVKRWDRSAYFVDKTIDFLSRHKGQPCFVNLWPDDVHTPWVPSDEAQKEEKDSRERFELVLKEYDRQVGRLLDGLKELGMDENTIVIFASDNGALPTFQGERSGGLRGSKLSLYEGGIRMPFIVRWPAGIPAGVVDKKSLINGVDLFPTFCALGGATLPKGVNLDGQNLSASFQGRTAKHKGLLFWEYGRNTNSFAFAKGKDRSPNLAVRDGQWKLLLNADGTGAELYDLEADPNEDADLAEKNPRIVKRLSKELLTWRKSLPELVTSVE